MLFTKVPTNDVTGSALMPEKQKQKTLGLEQRPLGPEAINGWITTDTLYGVILEKKPYAVKGLVSFGCNFLMSHSDGARGAKALDALEFMVHADMFMSPTAERADIVLPVNTPWEREGMRTNSMVSQEAAGHVQLRAAMVETRGESRSDAWITFALAERLGYAELFWNSDGDAAPGFNTPSKKVEIYSETLMRHGYDALPDYVEPGMGVADKTAIVDQFPLILTSAKSPQYLGSQGRAIAALRRIEPEPRIEIHPETAVARGIQDGDRVALLTPHGRLLISAKFSPSLHPNVVVAVHGWWQESRVLSLAGYDPLSGEGANLNAAFANETIDPIGGAAPHKCYACQVMAFVK